MCTRVCVREAACQLTSLWPMRHPVTGAFGPEGLVTSSQRTAPGRNLLHPGNKGQPRYHHLFCEPQRSLWVCSPPATLVGMGQQQGQGAAGQGSGLEARAPQSDPLPLPVTRPRGLGQGGEASFLLHLGAELTHPEVPGVPPWGNSHGPLFKRCPRALVGTPGQHPKE